VLKPLIRLLLEASDSRIREIAAYALATLGSKLDAPTAINQLIGVLEGTRKFTGIQNYLAWALLQTDGKKTAIPVLKYLKDNHMETLRKALFPEYEIMM
jgi:HEAT repeat protein